MNVRWLAWHWLIVSLCGYIWIAREMSLRANWGALRGLYSFTPSIRLGLGYVVVVCGLYLVYGRLALLLRQGGWRPTAPVLFLSSVFIAIPTIFTYPFNANDIFRYALRGRITALYGGNPYIEPPSIFPSDFFVPLAGEWVNATTPYGPIWELIAAGVALLSNASPYGQILLLKLVSLGAFWLIGWLIWWGMGRCDTGERLCYTFLWWGNPALLLTFGVDGHNDSVMLLWLVLGWLVWQNGRRQADFGRVWLGLLIMWLGPLTKAISLLAIPFFALASWSIFSDWKRRIFLALAMVISYIAVAIVSFAPFGSLFAYIDRLANEATGRVGFSLPALIILAVQDKGGTINVDRLGAVFLGLFALTAFLLCWWTWWYGRDPVRGVADIFFAYVVQAFNFRLWYTTWLFPFLLLDGINSTDDKSHQIRLEWGLLFLLCGQLVVFAYSHLWHHFDREHLWTHVWGVPLLFLAPPVLVWLRRRIGAITA